MKLKALGEQVILEELEEEISSNIIIKKEKKKNIGRVVAVGPGKELPDGNRIKPKFKAGDTVMWDSKYGVERYEDGDKTYIICNSFAYILAIIDEK